MNEIFMFNALKYFRGFYFRYINMHYTFAWILL